VIDAARFEAAVDRAEAALSDAQAREHDHGDRVRTGEDQR
jgi:multidrug resistance efflux pump